MEYQDIPEAEAYRLLNTGGIVLVCTHSDNGWYDIAPVAWASPLDFDPTSRVLVVMDPAHLTVANIEKNREFVLALPSRDQLDLVTKTGSVSGREVDKFAEFSIKADRAELVDAMIPSGVAGELECRLLEIHRIGSVAIIAGEVIRACAIADAWKHRLHMTTDEGFYRPGERL